MTCLPKGELSGANVAQAPDSGRGGGIRTPDILLPKQARYQTALHPEEGGGRDPRAARSVPRMPILGNLNQWHCRPAANSERIGVFCDEVSAHGRPNS